MAEPIQFRFKALMNSLADSLDKLFAGFGWTLLVFDFGKNGTMNFISNAKEEDMIAAMKEFVAKHDATPNGVAPPMTQRYVHTKSGRSYWLRFRGRSEAGGLPVAIYSSDDGLTWVRPLDEFEDKFKLPQ